MTGFGDILNEYIHTLQTIFHHKDQIISLFSLLLMLAGGPGEEPSVHPWPAASVEEMYLIEYQGLW
jgi:hypothetical protein